MKQSVTILSHYIPEAPKQVNKQIFDLFQFI